MNNTLALAKKLTANSLLVLLKYPTWRGAINEAMSLGQLPPNYQPQIIEFFDQQGLLALDSWGMFLVRLYLLGIALSLSPSILMGNWCFF
jgi:hypothetical protein